MVRKIILLIIFCLFINSFDMCFAADNYSYVSAVEQKLFNTNFRKENINKRLDRIEDNVFGAKTSGEDTSARIKKLKTVFGQMEKTSAPAKTNNPAPKTASLPKIQKEDPSIKYTVVDELEKKVLNRAYTNDDIYQRLNRLEIAVFNHSVNAPLNVRVDNLKVAVYGNSQTTQDNNSEIPQINNTASLSNDSVKVLLGKMENDVLNQTYPNDSLDSRLSRLEMKMFNSASPEDPVNDRIERLSAVISALPSNELYKDQTSLRQYQNMSAKMSAAAILLLIIQGLLF